MKTPKVLFITLRTFSLTGGIENVCKSIAYHYEQAHLAGTTIFRMVSLYDHHADPKYISPTLFKGYQGSRFSGFMGAVLSGLKQDIVILSHINLAPIGLLIKVLSPKTKVVLWTHGIEVWRPINSVKKRFLSKVDQIIAVSEFTAKSLTTWHQVDAKKVYVIPNALDPFYEFPKMENTAQIVQERYQLNPAYPIFMAVTRIKASEKNKNYDLVIQVLAQLKNEGFPSYYFLCGKYEEGEHQRLKALAEEQSVEAEFIMPGYLSNEELIELQMAANTFVLPSSKEGFGLVFMEAQAAGLRVIAGNQDGSSEAIKNSKAGILINPSNLEELKQAVKYNLTNLSSESDKLDIQKQCKAMFSFSNFSHHLNQKITH